MLPAVAQRRSNKLSEQPGAPSTDHGAGHRLLSAGASSVGWVN